MVLEKLVERCNDGFDGGSVTRSDVANRLIVESGKAFGEADVKALRNLSFDDRKMLHSLLQRSGKSGELPEEIRRALREMTGALEQPKKRGSRAPRESAAETLVDDSETAMSS